MDILCSEVLNRIAHYTTTKRTMYTHSHQSPDYSKNNIFIFSFLNQFFYIIQNLQVSRFELFIFYTLFVIQFTFYTVILFFKVIIYNLSNLCFLACSNFLFCVKYLYRNCLLSYFMVITSL